MTTAAFTWSPSNPTVGEPVYFQDKTVGPTPATSWNWRVYYDTFSTQQNAYFTFQGTGAYNIYLDVSGDGWSASSGPILVNVSKSVPWAYAGPICGLQFLDDEGKPLSYGWVTTYEAGGLSNRKLTYNNQSAYSHNPSSMQLNYAGRLLPFNDGEGGNYPTVDYPYGWQYNVVVTKEDGETVTQTILNSNTTTPTTPLAGDNVTVIQPDNWMLITTVSSTTTDPLFNQGDTNLFWLQSNAGYICDGAYNYQYTGLRKVPATPLYTPDVAYEPGVGFVVNRAGAYRVDTTFSLYPNWGTLWPFGNTGYGSVISLDNSAGFNANNRHTRYAMFEDYIGDLDKQKVVFSDSNIVTALKGQVMKIGTYVYEPGTDTPMYYNMWGSVQITFVGNYYPQYVTVPYAAFYANPQTGDVPLTVSCGDVSTELPTSWFYDFGDGATSTLQNPTHTYTQPGDYTINHTATNAAGTSTNVSQQFIHATGIAPPPSPIVLVPFNVANTGSALRNTVDVIFSAVAGQTIIACTQGLAGAATGDDTYLRMNDPNGNEFASNDDAPVPYDVPNGLASYIQVVAPFTGNYTLFIGAFGNTLAMGTAAYQVI
jgi:PKD repeat protein